MVPFMLIQNILGCCILSAFSFSSVAQTSSRSLSNEATVVSACTIRVDQHIVFGTFNPLNVQAKTATGLLKVNCTKGSYSLSRNMGSNALNRQKRITTGNYDGTLSGNYAQVDLTCTSSMKSSDGKFIEYRMGEFATFSSSYTGSNRMTSAENRNCNSGDRVFVRTLTFSQNLEQSVGISASIGSASDLTPYKSLTPGSYSDTVVFYITF